MNLDGKDQKSIANKLDQASKQEKREEQAEQANRQPPTQAALDVSNLTIDGNKWPLWPWALPSSPQNGNEPSRGAKIDEQIELEEAAELRKKGIEP